MALYHSLWEREKALKDVGSPELIAEKINVSVSADTDIFDTDLKAPERGFWILRVLTDTAGYPKVKETVEGASVIGALNGGSDLSANAWYEFWMTANEGDLINVQFSVAAKVTVRVFFVRVS